MEVMNGQQINKIDEVANDLNSKFNKSMENERYFLKENIDKIRDL